MIRFVVYCFVYLFIATPTFASTLTAHIEPEHVQPGEPFQLILELDENAPSGLPDFGVLAHDFHITGTSHSTSYLFANGKSKTTSRWAVTLVPRYAGKLVIPSIQVGQARSEPLNIEVSDTNHTTTSRTSHKHAPDRALFIETNTSTENPYLNQETIYTVRIFHQASLVDAAYQPPQLGDALMISLGNNRQYQTVSNGEPYLVEEQQYALYPQKAGAQVLFPPKLQALVYADIPRRAQASGQAITLDVKPIPQDITSDQWLPASRLSLKEHYDSNELSFSEGHTLTRTITLKVTGLPAELIPPLSITKDASFNVYQDPPTQKNSIENNHVVGTVTYKISYLFKEPGQVMLPKETLTWFNTRTKTQKTVTLPERVIQIKALDGTSQPVTPVAESPIAQAPPEPIVETPKKRVISHAITLAVACIIATILCVLGTVRNKFKQSPSRALKPVKVHCLKNNPKATYQALLHWAKAAYPGVKAINLDDIAEHLADPELSAQLALLSKSLYSPENEQLWEGRALWRALRHALSKKRRRRQAAPLAGNLPPMNPSN